MRLQATMHYICIYRYVYIKECMPIYAKSPKVTITFIRRSKIVTQEMYGLVHISDFESIKCGKVQSNPNLLTVISLVNQTFTCGLITMGRFKFMDNNFPSIMSPTWTTI